MLLSARPPVYLSVLPEPYWFFMEFGMRHDVVRETWERQFLKRKLCERQNWRCCYCGRHVIMDVITSHPLLATFEHVVRRTDGGGDEEENLVIACGECNFDRGAISAYEYRGCLHQRVRYFR